MFLFGYLVGILTLPVLAGLVYLTTALTRKGTLITCVCDKEFGHNIEMKEHNKSTRKSFNVITLTQSRVHYIFNCPDRKVAVQS